jgi:2,4-diketo-3-deoxy-L-fuconate hydrolase
MKLLSCRWQNGVRLAVAVGDDAVDVTDLYPDMLALVAAGTEGLELVEAAARSRQPFSRVSDLELLAPIPSPRRNLFCVGWNYLRHYEEGVGKREGQEQELPACPTFFTKATTTVTGPHADIPLDPDFSDKLDWEAELAVVLARGGRDIPEDEALGCVFGYTAANDLSARDVMRRHGGQWFKGKSMDASCPMGPWLTTADEVPDPQALAVRCRVNGVLKQDGRTSDMIFSVARLIAELSRGLTLLPGDIVLTGTPDGVGFARTPPEFLRPGDEVEVSVEGVGQISNRIVSYVAMRR